MARRTERTTQHKGTVGVRELRQNLSLHLRRVAAGETLEVTEHGHPVAVLAPLPGGTDALEQMVRVGRARPPRRDLLELGPPLRPTMRKSLTETLIEKREERL